MNTEEDLYKYLNILILEAEIADNNNAINMLFEKHIFPNENERYECFEFFDKLVSLGYKLKYFNLLNKEYEWFTLTEQGIEAKKHGGYFKYIDFIKNKQLETTKPTIIAENYIGGNNHGIQSSNNFSNIPNISNTTANPSNEFKIKSIMLKFWTLTSENKLISGLLIIIIFWAIKKYFNIDFKI